MALLSPKPGIDTISFQQFLVGALLGYPALIQNHNIVGTHNGLEPVGDDDDGLFRNQSGDRLLNQHLVLGVKGGRCLVQQNNGGILQQSPGNGDSLLFPPRRGWSRPLPP